MDLARAPGARDGAASSESRRTYFSNFSTAAQIMHAATLLSEMPHTPCMRQNSLAAMLQAFYTRQQQIVLPQELYKRHVSISSLPLAESLRQAAKAVAAHREYAAVCLCSTAARRKLAATILRLLPLA